MFCLRFARRKPFRGFSVFVSTMEARPAAISGAKSSLEEAVRNKNATEVDRQLGSRMRSARLIAGISAHELASRLGVSVQQLGKYERAENRVPASRLLEIAQVLGFDVLYFYDIEGRSQESTFSQEALSLATEFDRLTRQDRGKASVFAHLVLRKLHSRLAPQPMK
jgi:transcriptional regulator with XRE-family HTH domain